MPLGGTLIGKGILSGTPTVLKSFSGIITGKGVLTATPTVLKMLAGTITGKEVLTGNWRVLKFAGTISGKGVLSGTIVVSKPLGGTIRGKAVLFGTLLVGTPFSLNNLVGIQYYAVLGPQYYFHFQDTEPFNIPSVDGEKVLQVADVKAAFSQAPRLGYGLWFSLTGKSFNISQMGAAATVLVSDWGDGTGAGPSQTSHTYATAGGYWVKVNDASGNASATRFIRVLNEGESVPARLDGGAQGTTEAGFSVRLSMQMEMLDLPANTFARPLQNNGLVREGTAIGIFVYKPPTNASSTVMGQTFLVVGGFASDISFQLNSRGNLYNFSLYGPSYWLLNSVMREQSYSDPGILNILTTGGVGNTLINGKNPLTEDVLNLGYQPNHWIKCLPTVVAMHVLQHVQVGAVWDDGISLVNRNPLMAVGPFAPGVTASYGNIAQFMDVVVDDDSFYATNQANLPGFQGFSVSDGQVLSNIRQLLDNEGWRFYERHDLTLCFERKPQYRFDVSYSAPAAAPVWNYNYPVNHQPPPYEAAQSLWEYYYAALFYYGWSRSTLTGATADHYPDPNSDPNPSAAQRAAYQAFFYPGGANNTGIYFYIYTGQANLLGPAFWNNYQPKNIPPVAASSVFNPLKGRASKNILVITDLGQAAGEVTITRSLQQNVRQVIVEKPPLGLATNSISTKGYRPNLAPWNTDPNAPPLYPNNPDWNWGLLSSIGPYTLFNDSALTAQMVGPGGTPKLDTGTTGRDLWNRGMADMFANFGITADVYPTEVFIDSAEEQISLNPETYLVRYPFPARNFGKTIGPLRNVFTTSGTIYAQGRDKEERIKWHVSLPIGENFGVGLGDLVAITYTNYDLGVDWSNGKLFDVLAMELRLLAMGKYACVLTLQEIDPGEPRVVTTAIDLEQYLSGNTIPGL